MRINLPSGIMSSRYFSGEDERAIGLEDLKNFSPANLGIDLSNLPTIDPESIQQMPAPTPTTGGIPGSDWWKEAGYPDAATAIMSGNFRYDMNRGWLPKEETSTNMGAMTSPTLGPLGTSGMSIMEGEPMTMDTDIDRAIARALASGRDMPMQVADDPVMAAVETAVGNGQPTTDDTILDLDDVVIGGAMTTQYYNPATGETFLQTNTAQPVPEGFIKGSPPETPAQPNFMTQLNELIAQMQAEQTAAAEAQAAAEAEKQKQAQEFIASMQAKQTAAAEQAAAAEQQRQEQVAAMTQNYMVGQPAVGYNPYESGQYQNNPYGSAGVPDMGGITSIPVPAAYTPNPYLTGGMT